MTRSPLKKNSLSLPSLLNKKGKKLTLEAIRREKKRGNAIEVTEDQRYFGTRKASAILGITVNDFHRIVNRENITPAKHYYNQFKKQCGLYHINQLFELFQLESVREARAKNPNPTRVEGLPRIPVTEKVDGGEIDHGLMSHFEIYERFGIAVSPSCKALTFWANPAYRENVITSLEKPQGVAV